MEYWQRSNGKGDGAIEVGPEDVLTRDEAELLAKARPRACRSIKKALTSCANSFCETRRISRSFFGPDKRKPPFHHYI